jgi:hypothetical protein
VGSGFQLIATDGRLDSPRESVYGLIPISQVRSLADGSHHVYVRGQDEAGNWGDLAAANLVVDKTAPLLQSPMTATFNPITGTPPVQTIQLSARVQNDTTFAAAEYWTGTGDPGAGNATQVSLTFVNGSVVVTAPFTGGRRGSVVYHLRVQDMAGSWSNALELVVRAPQGPQGPGGPGGGPSPAAALLADSFGTGTLALWAQVHGAPGALTVGRAAGIPAGAGNQGLVARLPGGRRNVAAFVTDTSPAAESGYHARFAFDPHTLRTGTAPAVTVFQGRSSTGSVFAVQMRRTAVGRQLRGVLGLAHGRTRLGAWRTVPAGAHTLTVDWLATTHDRAASLRLAVDGAVSQVTGGRDAARLESVRLGVVSGFTRTTAGTAWFDEFSSSRTTTRP